jgi:hypothetical protein
MLRKSTLIILPVLSALLFGTSTASAQPFIPKRVGAIIDKFVSPDHCEHYHVMYRQPCWKSKTFFNHAAAHNFEHYLESKGYQAKVIHHGSHYHVQYRFLHWKQYTTVHSHSQAHHIEHQLEMQGYEAKVVHH